MIGQIRVAPPRVKGALHIYGAGDKSARDDHSQGNPAMRTIIYSAGLILIAYLIIRYALL